MAKALFNHCTVVWARRTKSSRPDGPKGGPKGLWLEVGARRAPKLLVQNKAPVWKCESIGAHLAGWMDLDSSSGTYKDNLKRFNSNLFRETFNLLKHLLQGNHFTSFPRIEEIIELAELCNSLFFLYFSYEIISLIPNINIQLFNYILFTRISK